MLFVPYRSTNNIFIFLQTHGTLFLWCRKISCPFTLLKGGFSLLHHPSRFLTITILVNSAIVSSFMTNGTGEIFLYFFINATQKMPNKNFSTICRYLLVHSYLFICQYARIPDVIDALIFSFL